MQKVNLGLVGVGRIGAMHARTITALRGDLRAGGVEVDLALTDVAADRARAEAADLGARFVPSVAELLDSGLDALVVATGTGTHCELIRAGVDAGLPVFCEKPVALSAADALPLVEHVSSVDGRVMIGHQRRFDPGYLEAKRAYRAGELGWIHSLRAVTCDAAPPPVEFLRDSGGLFRDCSVHDFDILRWLTGREAVTVYAVGSNNGDPAIGLAGDVDTALAAVTLDDGTLASVSASRYNGAGHDVRLEIQGSTATMVVGLDQHAALRSAEPGSPFPSGPPHLTFAERFASAYRAQMAAFVAFALGADPNPCSLQDSVAASLLADAAQDSLASGLPVQLSGS